MTIKETRLGAQLLAESVNCTDSTRLWEISNKASYCIYSLTYEERNKIFGNLAKNAYSSVDLLVKIGYRHELNDNPNLEQILKTDPDFAPYMVDSEATHLHWFGDMARNDLHAYESLKKLIDEDPVNYSYPDWFIDTLNKLEY